MTGNKVRANLGFADIDADDPLVDIDLTKWTNGRAVKKSSPPPEAAALSGFSSREPTVTLSNPSRQQLRRRRTGRDAQLNLKVTPAVRDQFYAIADSNGWGLGETLEQLIASMHERASSSK